MTLNRDKVDQSNPVAGIDAGDSTDQSLAPQSTFQYHQDLVKWVTQHGGFLHKDVVIRYEQVKGYHARVDHGKSISKETQIASCPMEAALCILNPLNIKPFSCRGVVFPKAFLESFCTSPDILHNFFLMEQYLLGEKSWWAPYFATLPTPDEVKDNFLNSQKDQLWIQGTNLEAAVGLQERKWQDNYFTGLEQLEQMNWPNAKNELLTWDLFRWAATIFGTRSFTSQVLSDTTPADLARPLGRQDKDHTVLAKLFSERFAVLLPLLDILNHRPAAKIEWQARYSYVGLEVLEAYEQDQEIFNNYGPRDNESLLLSYGFVLEDNQFDHIVISIKVPPGSPLADARTWPVDSRSNEHFNCYIFGPRHPIINDGCHLERALFSYDLLDSISVLLGNDRELQIMYQEQKTLMSSCLPHGFTDFHNIISTITQLLQDCRARALRIQLSDPARMDPPRLPETQKQRSAQIYRKNQLELLQTAMAVCAFAILHAATDLPTEDLLLTVQVKLPHLYHPTVDSLARRLPCLTKSKELLTIDDILRLLPVGLSTPLEACIQEMTKAQDNLTQIPTCHSNVMKSGFAIALSAMCCEHGTGGRLGQRLQSWLQDLMQWYPPTDENWSYVPHPGPWAPDEEPPPALMTLLSVISSKPEFHANSWLRPEMVCWGWNVMEEEGVRVPLEVEQFCNGLIEVSVEEGAIGYLVYCKQYSS